MENNQRIKNELARLEKSLAQAHTFFWGLVLVATAAPFLLLVLSAGN